MLKRKSLAVTSLIYSATILTFGHLPCIASDGSFLTDYIRVVNILRSCYFDKSEVENLTTQPSLAINSREDFFKNSQQVSRKLPYTWLLDCAGDKDCGKGLGPLSSRYDIGVDFQNIYRYGDRSIAIKKLGNGIVHVQVPLISVSNVEALANAKDLLAAKGIILDFVGNDGGDVDASIDLCSLFLDHGTVLFVEKRKGRHTIHKAVKLSHESIDVFSSDIFSRTVNFPRKFKKKFSQPVVVNVGPVTAGAAEIVVAALKDVRHATVIGVKTCGRGVGSDVFRGNDWIALVGSCKYVRPNGKWIGSEKPASGIFPDIEVFLYPKFVEVSKRELQKLSN